MNPKLAALENEMALKKEIPEFYPGDELEVHVKIKEGEKEREQIFAGTCIARKGERNREMVTVRKISYGESVERIFPLYGKSVAKIRVLKSREDNRLAPRAKLYYLRRKAGSR